MTAEAAVQATPTDTERRGGPPSHRGGRRFDGSTHRLVIGVLRLTRPKTAQQGPFETAGPNIESDWVRQVPRGW